MHKRDHTIKLSKPVQWMKKGDFVHLQDKYTPAEMFIYLFFISFFSGASALSSLLCDFLYVSRSPFLSLSLSLSLFGFLSLALDLLSVCTWNYFEHCVFIFILIFLLFLHSLRSHSTLLVEFSLPSMWNQARTCFNFSKYKYATRK